jgi:membrane associated rhomboid family serine protease
VLRRIEPLTAALVLACVGWTLYVRQTHMPLGQAGALARDRIWMGEYYRLFTAALLHAPNFLLHVGANCVGLAVLGPTVVRECGRGLYAFALLVSVLGGWSAGLVAYPPSQWQLGISGGVLGLIGVLLAVEWAVAPSWRAFLRAWNTWVLVGAVVLGALVTWHMNSGLGAKEGLVVSQYGHAGGFAAGLVTGLAYLGAQGRRRPVRCAVVGLVVGVAPLLYLGHPVYDAAFVRLQARHAFHAERWERAVDRYARVVDLDETRLDRTDRVDYQRACLRVAAAALADDLPRAEDLFARAGRTGAADARAWNDFGRAAADAGREALAAKAFALAAAETRREGRASEAWKPARDIALKPGAGTPPGTSGAERLLDLL